MWNPGFICHSFPIGVWVRCEQGNPGEYLSLDCHIYYYSGFCLAFFSVQWRVIRIDFHHTYLHHFIIRYRDIAYMMQQMKKYFYIMRVMGMQKHRRILWESLITIIPASTAFFNAQFLIAVVTLPPSVCML